MINLKLIKDYLPIFIDGFMPRMNFILVKNDFSLFERIKLILPGKQIKINVIKNRICKDENQQNYVNVGKYKIYYDIEYNISDENIFFEGITQVIWETFVIPEFLHPDIKPKNSDIVFDIGANIGTTSLVFSECVGTFGKVYSFEPVTVEIIQKNMEENNIKNVTIIPKGVSFQNGEIEIDISDFCLDSSIVKNKYATNNFNKSKKINLITIDDYCVQNKIEKIDFIKMDIEGAEEFAILGAKNMIKKCHPSWSISSYHIDSKNEFQHNKLLKLLKSFGYKTIELRNVHIWAYK